MVKHEELKSQPVRDPSAEKIRVGMRGGLIARRSRDRMGSWVDRTQGSSWK